MPPVSSYLPVYLDTIKNSWEMSIGKAGEAMDFDQKQASASKQPMDQQSDLISWQQGHTLTVAQV